MDLAKLFFVFLLQIMFTGNIFCQNYSIRTNLFNLAAKGPSVAIGKYLKNNNEVLITFSSGNFSPFFKVDYYKYSTVHAEYRVCNNYSWGKPYAGGYVRYIKKRIITNGYTAGPYGLFSKQDRNFFGNGASLGMTIGVELNLYKKWMLDLNGLIGGGKYLTQTDYASHTEIPSFLDMRIALQVGYKF